MKSLPPKLQSIITKFQSVQDPKSKYQQLLFYSRNLPPLHPSFKTPQNKVPGCVSQVWVRASLQPDRTVRFEADSDSSLTKGLAALLVIGLSGLSPNDIARLSPDFIQLLGLQQSLTPSRTNGFLNMLRLMQSKALDLDRAAPRGHHGRVPNAETTAPPMAYLGSGDDKYEISMPPTDRASDLSENQFSSADKDGIVKSSDAKASGLSDTQLRPSSKAGSDGVVGSDGGHGVSSRGRMDDSNRNSEVGLGSRAERIKKKLEEELRPIELEVEDVSHQHAGHAGVRGSDGETHFNLKIVSKEFQGRSLVKRHRMIYDLLQDELRSGLHALSIVAKTPSELRS